ncbi:MaoC family dehydratase [Streptomyces sp. URMC 126]|uniref:MaoC family dehydratase n=1 Tax=Streptomyces sp. URMC 126 TaxID=3423401 RepID=UPI003F1CDB27
MSMTRTATAVFGPEDIDTCARLTGDRGAHHMAGLGDRRMTQGVLTLTAVPLLGDPGAHLREVSLTFLAPVRAGDTVTATVHATETEREGVELPPDRALYRYELSVVGRDGEPVLTGTGLAELPRAQDGAD